MSDPILSVVTATYNRKDTLKMSLEHLSRQTLPADDFEMVVVDDGSSDGTGEMIRTLQYELPFTLRYFHQRNQGPGAANNRGAREARADLINFIADDISRLQDENNEDGDFDYSQLIKTYPILRACRQFQPSDTLLGIIWEIVLNNASPDPLTIMQLEPAALGQIIS